MIVKSNKKSTSGKIIWFLVPLYGGVVFILLFALWFFFFEPIIYCSKLTINNKTSGECKDLMVVYDNYKPQIIRSIKPRQAVTIKLHFKSEAGMHLAYTFQGSSFESKEIYVEPLYYHIYFDIDEKGKPIENLDKFKLKSFP